MDQPHFLVMQPYHLSREKARDLLLALLRQIGANCLDVPWEKRTITFRRSANGKIHTWSKAFTELVRNARETGIVSDIQDDIDRRDNVFGGTFDDCGTPNWNMSVGIEYAGFKRQVQGPCQTVCVEKELARDIIEFRKLTCDFSNEYDIRRCARYFRAYISCCVSIVEAFINRHILLARHDGFHSEPFSKLKDETKLESKVKLWWETCSPQNPEPFFKSKAWCHFQEIRIRRNEFLHALDPISAYSIREMQTYLNKVRTGVGELLFLLRKAHSHPTLGFIETLRTAPVVDYRQIDFMADGLHKIKLIQG